MTINTFYCAVCMHKNRASRNVFKSLQLTTTCNEIISKEHKNEANGNEYNYYPVVYNQWHYNSAHNETE